MMTETPTVPTLVGLGPGPTTGRQLMLSRDQQSVGRAAGCDIRLTDAQVGPRHAMLTNRDGRTWVRDLGSPGGTFVNGQRLGAAPHPLRRGDVVVFGTVALRLAAELEARPPAPREPATDPIDRPHPAARPARPPAPPPDDLLREVASWRTWAGRLLGGGGVAFLLGFGLFTASAMGLLTNGDRDRTSQPLGPDLLGVPCGLFGWGLSAVGMVLLIVGMGLLSAATARRRQLDRELPWPRSGGRTR